MNWQKPWFTPPSHGSAGRWFAVVTLGLALAGCVSDSAFRQGDKLVADAETEAGLAALEQEVAAHPGNAQYRSALVRAREADLRREIARADALARDAKLAEAAAAYRGLLQRFPDDARLVGGLGEIQVRLDNQALLKAAEDFLAKNEPEAARARLRAVLAREPGNLAAQRLLKQAEEKVGLARGVDLPQLGAGFRRPVSLEFRDAPMKQVFDALSRQSGLNFVFDKDVKLDQRTTVFARDTAITDALDALLATSQLAKKILNASTVLIYPNQPAKVKDYQEQVVKSFFLAHAEAKNVMALIRTLARIKDVYVDEKLNMVAVRDTPEAVRLAEKLVRMADRPDAEVMLEVEILEVKRSRLQNLGVQWPNQFSVLSKLKVDNNTATLGGTALATSTQFIDVPQTLDLLKHIGAANIGISPAPTVNIRKDTGDVNILANPRIRVKNREKAKIHIGDKVPVITTNTTSTGVISESVSYLDVGLKLDVEPQIGLDGDVTIKVGLEVSNIVNQVKSTTGTVTYQLGSRNADTVLRLRDGETQVLAGLISDEDRGSASKVPGLGDLPILGHLFASKSDELDKTEIVLSITPRIVRNIERPELADAEFFAGTDSQTGDQPLTVRNRQSPASADPVNDQDAVIQQVLVPGSAIQMPTGGMPPPPRFPPPMR
jgi:general secretion pathway protein D